ncbi:MAG: dihydrofolate synthase / folylpolyglutamate synthase [Candidatus Tokpelaia sp. JSC189]|nr:MAG: dihydrofolate synthase / folylpolyglutamate synthase [Candidatus Tokpelaia sp. JSC189]
MAKTAQQHIKDLLNIHPQAIDLSLERIRRLLADLDNPHLKIPPTIHIAGTNGKGSASAFSRAILEAAGYRVHVHTSPHLVHWHERYRIGCSNGGRFVTDKKLADTIAHVSAVNDEKPITVFEILTATAFFLFSQYPADATIMEVGLGGRFDATNVIAKPAVSLIMPVSLDHQSFLGECVEDIAMEKAGIIKKEMPVVIGFQESEAARNILVNKAWEMEAPVSVYGQDYMAYEELGHMIFQNQNGPIDLPLPHLSGAFQISNAAAAIEAVSTAGFQIEKLALAHAMCNVNWPTRMQKLQYGKLVDLLPANAELWLDGGHNLAAALVTARTVHQICETKKKKLILVCGMLNTKDATRYLSAFKDIATRVYTVPVHFNENGMPAEILAEVARTNGLDARSFNSVAETFADIRNTPMAASPLLILICGSLYLAGATLWENDTLPQ